MGGRFIRGFLTAATAGIGASVLAPVAAYAAVACGQTITTSMSLTADLSCPGDGIVISASNVVLNLGGHTLAGPAPTGSFHNAGVRVTSGHHNVTIANGTIRGFEVGVNLSGLADARVTGLTFDGNGMGFNNPVDASGVVVSGNTFRNLNHNAMQVGGTGFRVEGNTITDVAGSGVLFSGSQGVIKGNRITNAGAVGVASSTFGGSNPGPFVGNQIVGNVISGSGRTFNSPSISLENGSSTLIENNTITGRRTTPGVIVDDSSGTVVSGNSSANNSTGVLLLGSTTGTQVLRNRATQNNFSGISVESSASGTLVSGNTAYSNNGNGIDVRSAATTVTANTAFANRGLGIFAVPGVTDGGGNRAFSNGNAAQCSPNIAC